MPLRFELQKTVPGGNARRGRLSTAHGVIETPVFMPVGTLGSVKSLDPRDLHGMGATICLANAYHLLLRPGDDVVRELGGLHRFTGWSGAILTDSGGFQVYSLAHMRKVTDHGVTFRSHIDGSLYELTPERLVQLQENLGPDIAMVLDECPPAQAERAVVEQAVQRTTQWAQRAVAARKRSDVAWFGITQGALFDDLRIQHAQTMTGFDFHGFAIGGVSVGEAPEDIDRIVALTAPLLPAHKPRYLMGVGTPRDIITAVAAGVDMFDCVMPTRNARNGTLFTSAGRVSIKNARYRQSSAPLDPLCDCYTCTAVPVSFLRHLYVCGELSYSRLATLHNLTFYLQMMRQIRADLDADRFDVAALLARWGAVSPA